VDFERDVTVRRTILPRGTDSAIVHARMAHRGQWSEHEARGILVAWRKSGLSIERFAKERGLVPQRVRWWKNKLEGTGVDGDRFPS
jgi:hypothetical protein